MSTNTLQLVKPSEIEIQEGHNPRGEINEKGETFKSLVNSIKDVGVLQPLLVSPRTNGHWPLVDGERRLRAARAAKVKQIPVYAVQNLDEFYAAIIANLEREDLTPMEEASAIARMQDPGAGKKGLTQPQIAKKLGRSERWVRGRLDLLKLPDIAHSAIDSGELGIEAAQKLAQLAKQAPRLAAEATKAIADPKQNWDESVLQQDYQFDRLLQSVAAKAGYVWLSDFGGVRISKLPVSAEVKKELTAKAKPLPDYEKKVDLTNSGDVAAMKKAGIHFEIPSGYHGKSHYVDAETGKDWLETTAAKRLDSKIKARSKQQRELDERQSQSAQDRKKEAEREERKRAKEREQKQNVNLKLGEGLRKMAKPKVTADVARFFVTMALNLVDTGASDLSGPLALTRGDRHEVIEGRSGVKVEVDHARALTAFLEDLEHAKTPEAIFGIGLQVLTAARFAETSVEPKNHYWFDIPQGVWTHDVEGYPEESVLADADEQLAHIALTAGVLPDSIRKEVEEELERKAKQRVEFEAERQKEEEACELRVLSELDKLNGKEDKPADQLAVFNACENSKGGQLLHNQPFHHIAVEAALERLTANRQISRIDAEDEVPAYKLNPSGRARIEEGAK